MRRQKITITLAGKEFMLEVTSANEEEKVRKAAAEINTRLTNYQNSYPGKGLEDMLSFIALNICMDNITLRGRLESCRKESELLQKDIESYLENIEK